MIEAIFALAVVIGLMYGEIEEDLEKKDAKLEKLNCITHGGRIVCPNKTRRKYGRED